MSRTPQDDEQQAAVQPVATAVPWARPQYWGHEEAYVAQALASTWISGGPFVERFEAELAVLLGTPHVTVVCNGTAALHLAYLGLGLGPGDEIILPGFCFLAAANVAKHVGASPVFAEVDAETWCLDVRDVEARITDRTRLIVPIHTYGNMCDMAAFTALAEETNIPIVEDAAQAFGSIYRGRCAGTYGMLGTFSFHATKTITTGEGGAVITGDSALQERLALFRSHGMGAKRYFHEVYGHNFRLTNLQAAIGCAQLEKLDSIRRERFRIMSRYRGNLSTEAGVTLQTLTEDVEPVLWALAVRLDPALYPQGRDRVIAQMQEAGVETRPGFHAPSEMVIYPSTCLPVCESLSRSVICLPTFPALSDSEIDYVCDMLLRVREHR